MILYEGTRAFLITAEQNAESYLMLTPALLAEISELSCNEIWFEMGSACLRIPVSMLTGIDASQVASNHNVDAGSIQFAAVLVPDPYGELVTADGTYRFGLFIKTALDLIEITGELEGMRPVEL